MLWNKHSLLLIYEWVICPLVQGQQCVWMDWLLSVLIFFFPRKCEGVFEVTVDLMDICQIWGCCCAMDLTFQLLLPILRIKNKKRNQFTHSLNHTMHSNLRESSITKITQSLVELGVWKFIHQLANRDDRQAICPTSLHSGECNDNNPQTSSHEFLERRRMINQQEARKTRTYSTFESDAWKQQPLILALDCLAWLDVHQTGCIGVEHGVVSLLPQKLVGARVYDRWWWCWWMATR